MEISKFVANNQVVFKATVMDGDTETHLLRMQHLTFRDTHVELLVAAPVYHIPNFLTLSTHPSDLDYVELVRLKNCHLDCILHKEGGFSLDTILEAVERRITL